MRRSPRCARVGSSSSGSNAIARLGNAASGADARRERGVDVGLMVEGQNGLTWERWRHILALAERLGLPSVHRSDHYFIRSPQDSLEAYLSFAVAAVETQRIRFGPLVSPITFRHPVDLARMAAQLDVLSSGRFRMGLGAGWHEPEHIAYGLPFPPVRERLDRLEEALGLVRALWTESAATIEGRYYQLDAANLLPKPPAGRPRLTIGGAGERRTLRLVAEHADEWNCVMLAPEAYGEKAAALARHCADVGRDPATIRRSMMIFGAVGATEADVARALRLIAPMFGLPADAPPAVIRERATSRGALVGTTNEVAETLSRYAALGLAEVQIQHLDFASDEVPTYLAQELAPRVAGL